MLAKEIMVKDFKFLTEFDTLEDACKMMRQYDIGIIPIIKNHVCINLLTDRDIVLLLSKDFKNQKLNQLEKKEIVSVNQEDTIAKVYDSMSNYQIKRMIVTNEAGNMAGIISLSDIILTNCDRKSLDTVLEIKKPLVNNLGCPSNSVKVDDFPL